MSSSLSTETDKSKIYKEIYTTLQQFFASYPKLSFQAKLTSVASAVKNNIPDFFFVGFYIVETSAVDNSLVLEVGPYQSTILATPRIAHGAGVCGTAWKEAVTQVVNDVKACKNYIACDGETKAEIVIPVFDATNTQVIAVFDIDSTVLNRFDKTDQDYLEKITSLINGTL